MSENEKEVNEIVEDVIDDTEDTDDTDWKAEALKARGIAKRYQTKLEKAKAEPVKEVAPVKKEGFDYAEKAYLKASGISLEDHDFVKEVMGATGKSLDEVLEAKYFQADLAERRQARASKEAIPTGTKRSASAAKDEVSYWANKPFEEVPKELRREVLNSQMKKEQQASKFTDRPVG